MSSQASIFLHLTSENIIRHDSQRSIFFMENIFLLIILEGKVLMLQIFLK